MNRDPYYVLPLQLSPSFIDQERTQEGKNYSLSSSEEWWEAGWTEGSQVDIQVPENEWTDDKGTGKEEEDKWGINKRLKQAGSSWIGSIRAAKSCSFLLF